MTSAGASAMPQTKTMSLCARLGDLHPVFEVWCAHRNLTPAEAIKDFVAQVIGEPTRFSLSESAQERIRISLDKQQHIEFANWCDLQSLPKSAAVRLLVAGNLRQWVQSQEQTQHRDNATQKKSTLRVIPVVGQLEDRRARERLRLSLSQSEMDALQAVAQEQGLTPSKLTGHLVRAYLLNASLISKQEQIDLGAVNSALLRIGNNLNQIVRRLNANSENGNDELPPSLIQELRGCVQALQSHVKSSAQALETSRQRWRLELVQVR